MENAKARDQKVPAAWVRPSVSDTSCLMTPTLTHPQLFAIFKSQAMSFGTGAYKLVIAG